MTPEDVKARSQLIRAIEAQRDKELKQTLCQLAAIAVLIGASCSWNGNKTEAVILPSELTTEIKLVELKPEIKKEPSQNMGIPIIWKSPYSRIDSPKLYSKYSPYIYASAKRHGVDPLLLEALIKHESGFNPNAVSHCGAIGLTQLMPATAKALGVDPYDPIQNIEGGAIYLSRQLKQFKSKHKALAAYNAGPGAVQKYKGIPPYKETRNYVASITADYKRKGGVV